MNSRKKTSGFICYGRAGISQVINTKPKTGTTILCNAQRQSVMNMDIDLCLVGNPEKYRAPLKIPIRALNLVESGRRETGIGSSSHGPDGFF